jgi:ribosomal protein S27AE
MKLTHNTIPKEFLNHIPRGIKYVMRNGKDFLVVEQVFCPSGHSLIVDHVRLHSEPSICLRLRIGKDEGMIYLDSFWGSHDKLYNFIPNPKDAAAPKNDVMCPVCGISLVARMKKACKTCGSGKVIVMHLPGAQNKILACAKLGCPWHKLVADEIAHKYTEMVDDINYFGL